MDKEVEHNKEKFHNSQISLNDVHNLMEKFKLLNYEENIREMKLKLIGRFYFLKATNPGEQFFLFTSLCAWLIRKAGISFTQPQEFDDPNNVILKIIDVVKELGIPYDFPSNSLIQGAGQTCFYILDSLATCALKLEKILLHCPKAQRDGESAVDNGEHDAEIILEKIEEEQTNFLSDDSDDENNSALNIGCNILRKNNDLFDGIEVDKFTDVENWKLELERVLPLLKIIIKADPRDWRAHLQEMKKLDKNIKLCAEETQTQLKKMQTDIAFAIDKIESRENHLNNDLQHLIKKVKDASIKLSNINAAIKDVDMERENLNQNLTSIIMENEKIKSLMEQRGNAMSDGTPIMKIKKSIAKLKNEIALLNLEVALLSHTLDQDILQQMAMYADMQTKTNSLT